MANFKPKQIYDTDIGAHNIFPDQFTVRTTARAILLDDDEKIALMFVGKKKYHKLPGGGLELGETIEEGLRREIIEEVGCQIHQIQPIGITEEYRSLLSECQKSHGFIAYIKGNKGTPDFDQYEIADCFSLKWVSLPKALEILLAEKTHPDYEARFIIQRETYFLQKAVELLSLNH